MQSIIASLASRHGLSRAEVLLEIESAFSALLSRWYRRDSYSRFEPIEFSISSQPTSAGLFFTRQRINLA